VDLLLVSDIHRDLKAARSIVKRASKVDLVIAAGDFAVMREGLTEVIDILRAIKKPTVLVAGNAESPEELRLACSDWASAHVLHGDVVDIDGVSFYGLGGGVPVTPFGDWSYDLGEKAASNLLESCPEEGILVTHSPPQGHVDTDSSGESQGSTAILDTIQACRPRLVVCGHIHESWGERSVEGDTVIINAGPKGIKLSLENL